MVTSPRPARFAFASEYRDGVDSSVGKTVRALIFAEADIGSVTLRLPGDKGDNISLPMTADATGSPLYEAAWPPGYLEHRVTGVHRLTVSVELDGGVRKDFESDFSLDGSQLRYMRWSDVILLADWLPFSAGAFAAITLGIITLLASARILRHFLNRGHNDEDPPTTPALTRNHVLRFLLDLLRDFSVVASTDRLFKPLIWSSLYACFLPWCVGRVLGNRLAVIFVWGIILLDEPAFLSSDMAFIVGGLWHITTTFPLLLVLTNAVGRARARTGYGPMAGGAPNRRQSRLFSIAKQLLRFVWTNLGFLLICFMLAHNCVVLWWMYGLVAVFSPWGIGRIWLVVLLYRRANSLKRRDFEALGMKV